MTKIIFIIRLLTLLCYFLPVTFFFTTCTFMEFKTAYNKKDAEKIEAEARIISQLQDTGTYHSDTSAGALQQPDVIVSEDNDDPGLLERLAKAVIAPQRSSLSALGSVFYFKNLFGKIVMAVSLLLSLFLVFGSRLLKYKTHITVPLTVVNLLCFILFIAGSRITQVDLLWGAWVLFAFLLLQLFMEMRIAIYK